MSPEDRSRFNNNLTSVFQQERLWRATSTAQRALTRTHVVPVVRCRAPSSLHHGLFIEQRRTVRCVILASQPTYRQRGNGERGSSGNNKSPVGIQRGSSMKQHFLSMACHSSWLDWLKHEPSRVSMTTCSWLTRRVQDEWMWSGKLIKDKSRAGNVEGNFKQHAQKKSGRCAEQKHIQVGSKSFQQYFHMLKVKFLIRQRLITQYMISVKFLIWLKKLYHVSSEPKIFFSISSHHQEYDYGINLWYYQIPLVPQIILKSICVCQLYYWFPSKRLDREFGRYNGHCNLAAVSLQRAKTHTHTVRRAWISLPPHFIAHRLASRSASSLVCQRSRRRRGGLGSAGDMLWGAPPGAADELP